jgi:hypothetical protein
VAVVDTVLPVDRERGGLLLVKRFCLRST